jgi:hypothetical protein
MQSGRNACLEFVFLGVFELLILHYCYTIKIRNCRNPEKSFKINYARVAELADALDLGSSGETCGGSNPPPRTTKIKQLRDFQHICKFPLFPAPNCAVSLKHSPRCYESWMMTKVSDYEKK